ncbi:DUF3152 domain-containing protein [Streptomyces sp. P1-3]|uniref:DUF3152 domain-containing protein n=1 Tax=Streptomyces sp. P1-3 TaxID=3421658 RepID=UPI003D361C2C
MRLVGKHSARGSKEHHAGREKPAGGAGQPAPGRIAGNEPYAAQPPAASHEPGYDPGRYPVGPYDTGEYRMGPYDTGEYPVGPYDTGEHPAGPYGVGYDTGQYAPVYDTGELRLGPYGTGYDTGRQQAVQDTGAFAAWDGHPYETGSHAVPQARGGHPEQREPGGGWGAFGDSGAGPAAQGTHSPDFRPGGPPAGTVTEPPRTAGPRAAAPGVRVPGPRKEYVAAFDDLDARDAARHGDVRGAAAAGGIREADPAAGSASEPVLGSGGVKDGVKDGGPEGSPEGGPSSGAKGGGSGRRARGAKSAGPAKPGRGRRLTGIAAAAVTTVLAVVVTGQMTGGTKKGDTASSQPPGGTADRGDRASRDGDRPTPTRTATPPAPRTYAEKMAAKYPLDERLQASGAFTTIGGGDKAPGRGEVVRYRVDVEKGLPLDGELFAEAVHKTLNDDRSWGHGGTRRFERVSSGDVRFVISLASPGTTAKWCLKSGLDTTEDNVSCDSAATKRVMINAYRWAQGARTFGDDKLHAYRQMLINHEVGHRLGRNHEGCSKQGALAPVMMQQTKFLETDGATCRPNAWPFPES